MLESRLIEHLRVLNTTDFNDFLRYAKAMIEYEKDISEDTFLLLKYIYKNIDSDKKLGKDIVCKNLFPKEQYKSAKIEKLMSYAFKLLRNYIFYKNSIISNYELKELLALNHFYIDNEMHKQFEISINHLRKLTQNIPKIDIDDLYLKYKVDKELFAYKAQFNNRRGNLNLPETISALDNFYLNERLELALTAIVQNQYIPFDSEGKITQTLDAVLALAKHPAYLESKSINLFLLAIQLQSNISSFQKDIIFERFNVYIDHSKGELNERILSFFCTISRNYCVRQYSMGRNDFLLTLFDLFKIHLKNGVLYQKNKIGASTLQNIIGTAIKLKKYDFIKAFLIEHKDKITGTQQPELIWEYNMSAYYFEIKDYINAKKHMPNYNDLDDTFYVLSARRLEIRILYETEQSSKYDVLGSKLDAFKTYLFENKKNKKITEHIIEINNNFIDLVKQIRSTFYKDKERINKLLFKLEGSPTFAEREWLIEILHSMSDKKK